MGSFHFIFATHRDVHVTVEGDDMAGAFVLAYQAVVNGFTKPEGQLLEIASASPDIVSATCRVRTGG